MTASERIRQLQEELKQLKERFIRVAEDRDRILLDSTTMARQVEKDSIENSAQKNADRHHRVLFWRL